jgi:hypothetical protein
MKLLNRALDIGPKVTVSLPQHLPISALSVNGWHELCEPDSLQVYNVGAAAVTREAGRGITACRNAKRDEFKCLMRICVHVSYQTSRVWCSRTVHTVPAEMPSGPKLSENLSTARLVD